MLENNNNEIYNERMTKFMGAISRWQKEEHNQIMQKSRDQQQFERNKILSHECYKIDNQLSNSLKIDEMNAKIGKSRTTNEHRLLKMKAKDQMLGKVKIQASNALLLSLCNTENYITLTSNLILQGMLVMMESNLHVKCIQRDRQIVTAAIMSSKRKFQLMGTGLETTLQLDSQFLPESELGGIVLTAQHGKIVCNNTLLARLQIGFEQLLPIINKDLFGKTKKDQQQ